MLTQLTLAAVSSRNVRATPLPPDERRAAILAATVPLVRQRGLDVSTRQIAEAAEVAEGTLFRVFADKRALLHAAIEAAVDPEPGIRRLAEIDPEAPLAVRLTEAIDVLREGIQATWQLFASIRASETSTSKVPMSGMRTWEPIGAAIAKLFEPDKDRLAVPPRQAARVLSTMLIATMHQHRGSSDQEEPFTTAEMVDIILYGVVGRQAPDDPTTHETDGSRLC